MLPSETMRDWARYLFAFEADDLDPSGHAEPATFIVFEKLRHQFYPLVGVDGLQVLAARALKLATSDAPELSELYITAEGHLRRFDGAVPKLGSAPGGGPQDENGVLLIAHLFGLFLTFLGSATTRQLVRNAFPHLDDLPAFSSSLPFESISREVDRLKGVSERLEALAEEHAPVGDGLASIAQNVRSIATILDVFAVIKSGSDNLLQSDPKIVSTRYLM